MGLLDTVHPDVAKEFNAGHFVIQKTGNDFSGMAFDHGHEQNNAVIKGDGGVVGLTEDEDALRRWGIAMPEVIDLLDQYKTESTKVTASNHPERTMNDQVEFVKKVRNLTNEFNDLGNPFIEESEELYT